MSTACLTPVVEQVTKSQAPFAGDESASVLHVDHDLLEEPFPGPYFDTTVITTELITQVSSYLSTLVTRTILYNQKKTGEGRKSLDSQHSYTHPDERNLFTILYNTTVSMLVTMQTRFRIRESECICGVVLFQRYLAKSSINLSMYPTAFCVSMIVANKLGSDNPLQNLAWSKVFDTDSRLLFASEKVFLRALNYETYMKPSDFQQARVAILALPPS